MILHIKNGVNRERIEAISKELNAFHIHYQGKEVLITASNVKEVPDSVANDVESYWVADSDIQLASKKYQQEKREIQLGNILIGGSTKNTVLIGGPCSVESEEQIRQSSELLKSLKLSVLRGGCYKPRTSPYSFQGMGKDGLKLLAKMREEYGLTVITEARDATHIDDIIEYSDIIQVGAKAMYDQGILRACAKTTKPVLIKRGFGTTLQEFVQASEFVLAGGNPNVVLCERGIRTFETKTRFTLDLCGVAWLQEYTNLPIILDPSHAIGHAYGVLPLARACVAMGVDGLLIEAHPNPKVAKSDASQQLNHQEFVNLKQELETVAKAVGYNLI
ncbi:MAG: 3-deoxy-7-phosphoheptulonate synthase [Crocinitomicaceae bacterium]|nr:3-deoxy-7-phosphoheptulonate synthase [Crocinitomicaceae bacterium]